MKLAIAAQQWWWRNRHSRLSVPFIDFSPAVAIVILLYVARRPLAAHRLANVPSQTVRAIEERRKLSLPGRYVLVEASSNATSIAAKQSRKGSRPPAGDSPQGLSAATMSICRELRSRSLKAFENREACKRFDLSRFQVDIMRPYSIRSAPKSGVRANLLSEVAAWIAYNRPRWPSRRLEGTGAEKLP